MSFIKHRSTSLDFTRYTSEVCALSVLRSLVYDVGTLIFMTWNGWLETATTSEIFTMFVRMYEVKHPFAIPAAVETRLRVN